MKKLCNIVFMFLINIVLFSNFHIETFANHEHTSECYNNATLHNCNGDEINGGGCYSLPVYHGHSNECYNLSCDTNISDFESLNKSIGECEYCKKILYTSSFYCKYCGSSYEISNYCSSENCTNYKNVESCLSNWEHGTMSIENAKLLDRLSCTIAENVPIKYNKMCDKENGKYYYENGDLATPECGTVVVSYEPEVLYSTKDTFSNKVILTYMDGHTSTITAKGSTFNQLNSNTSYTNEPVTLYFDAKINVGASNTEQSVVVYYTNIIEEVEEVETNKSDNIIEEISPIPTKIENNNSTNIDKNKDKDKETINEISIKEEIGKDEITNNDEIVSNENIEIEIEDDSLIINDNNEENTNEKDNNNNNVLVIIIIIIVLSLIGGIGYFVYSKNKKN